MAKVSFPSKKFTTIVKLEIVHIDLSGPTRTRGFYGERYFMIFVDDFTRMVWVAFLKENSDAFEKFKLFKNRVENESRVKIKMIKDQIKVERLPQNILTPFVKKMVLRDNYQHLKPLRKLELMKEETCL